MQANSFDTYAKDYDRHFTFSPIGKLQRERVFRYFNSYLNSSKKILELNCGTGHDAIAFSKKGHQVTAIDISKGMIDVAKSKPNTNHVNFICMDTRELKSLQLEKVDVIFSNFGGWNCLNKSELEQVSSDCFRQLNTNGIIATVIMGSQCVWEDFYFKRIKHKGFRRRQNLDGVETSINGNTFTTWYYSPQELKKIFGEDFECELVKPIGLFVPPSYLNDYFRSKLWALRILSFLETIFGSISAWSNYADHYLMILKRKPD
jgi:ubiquinone/menaquinone biosynthesis C-methylase UbiE